MIQGNISATQSLTGSARETGIQGLSAYEVYKKNGGTLSEEEWLVSLKGEKGDKGEQGIQGERGAAFTYTDFTEEQLEGLVGPKGEKGEQGPAGPQGEHGAKGEKGDTGETGPQGPQGEQGPKGEKGEAFTYDMFTEEQLASLTGPQGPQGEQGIQGERGSDGISLEEVTTLLTDYATTEYVDEALANNSGGGGEIPFITISGSMVDVSSIFTEKPDREKLVEAIRKATKEGTDKGVILIGYQQELSIFHMNYVRLYNNKYQINYDCLTYCSNSSKNIMYLSYGTVNLNDDFTFYNASRTNKKIFNYNSIMFKDNAIQFTPTGDYNPATKKYVDDTIANAITTTLEGEY